MLKFEFIEHFQNIYYREIHNKSINMEHILYDVFLVVIMLS